MYLSALIAAAFVVIGIVPSYADANQTATSATFGSRIVAAGMMDFGSPPSGQIPILYNDHHVYAKPDVLRTSRVLAALVKNGTILVPLRSMFEQMGATVSYDSATKGFTIQKSGASIQLSLGKNEAVINGESRPLDQGPIMYHGVALVPIRVVSETMGAYVEWVPSQRVAVVRYLPATPAPTPAPTLPPTPPPTPAPTPKPGYLAFLEGGYTSGRAYNEFANDAKTGGGSGTGNNGLFSFVAAAAYLSDPWAFKVNMRLDQYNTTQNDFACSYTAPCPTPTPIPIFSLVTRQPLGAVRTQSVSSDPFDPGCLTPFAVATPNPNAAAVTPVPVTDFTTLDGGSCAVAPFKDYAYQLDGRVEYKVFDPRIYVGLGYVHTANGHGYPNYNGWGFGVEKLPDFNSSPSNFTWHGSAFYYPDAYGTYTIQDPLSPNFGATFRQEFGILVYDAGADFNLGQSPFYLYGGFSGAYYHEVKNAPVSQSYSGPYIGVGFHI